ncbi:hypothetical protein [Mucilaginibacter terrae]|uniref:Transcriptional antiterminator Rof (Rho-off) n=1 Tax=Mucilaginibacter terrae TaxID=1955052 RepID=A0ABU3GUU2_9SPHI|nr:hypothetical protein [Mucilaginibacter terrae]MDT3403549.1 transcriptional antiterminator Rof (Rho-off) [Mucilaginibacter terrae]
MKTLLLSISLLAATTCFAQKDYCKDIKKETDEFRQSVKYESPSLGEKINVQFYRTISKGFTFNKVIVNCKSSSSDYRAKELFLKLEDGTILSDQANTVVDCSYISGGYYLFVAVMELDSDDIEKLTKQKIVKVRLAHEERDLTEKQQVKLQAYVPCVFAETNK